MPPIRRRPNHGSAAPRCRCDRGRGRPDQVPRHRRSAAAMATDVRRYSTQGSHQGPHRPHHCLSHPGGGIRRPRSCTGQAAGPLGRGEEARRTETAPQARDCADPRIWRGTLHRHGRARRFPLERCDLFESVGDSPRDHRHHVEWATLLRPARHRVRTSQRTKTSYVHADRLQFQNGHAPLFNPANRPAI